MRPQCKSGMFGLNLSPIKTCLSALIECQDIIPKEYSITLLCNRGTIEARVRTTTGMWLHVDYLVGESGGGNPLLQVGKTQATQFHSSTGPGSVR